MLSLALTRKSCIAFHPDPPIEQHDVLTLPSFHYHGHNMHILQEGYGTWDGSIVNARNPARRDVHILHNAHQDGTPSYMVMQIEADNPGVWRKSHQSPDSQSLIPHQH